MPYGTVNVDKIVSSDGVTSGGTYGFKNRIINGAMVVSQRNGTSSVTPSVNPTYTLDRWSLTYSQGSKFSAQQNAGSVTPPAGYINYLGLTVVTSVSPLVTGDYFAVQQPIEGLNVADLAWGTASAATVTLSFWVRSSLTGTFGGALSNSAGSRSYPFTYTISSANTWEQKSVTIAGDTTGTWLTTNGVGVYVRFGLGAGATFSGTAGSWAASNYFSATSAVSVVSTGSATFYITGVQLEKGSTATSFDYRPYTTEFQLCQRYYELFGHGGAGKAGSGNVNAEMAFTFQVIKRANPDILFVGSAANDVLTECGVTTRKVSSIAGTSTGVNGTYVNSQTTVNGSGGVVISFANSIAPWLSASAEL